MLLRKVNRYAVLRHLPSQALPWPGFTGMISDPDQRGREHPGNTENKAFGSKAKNWDKYRY